VVPGIPAHPAEFVPALKLLPPENKVHQSGRIRHYFHLPLIPNTDLAGTKRGFHKSLRIHRLRSEALPLDCQAALAFLLGRLAQQRPGAQYPIFDHAQVKMRSAGFVMMNYKPGIHKMRRKPKNYFLNPQEFAGSLPLLVKYDSIFADTPWISKLNPTEIAESFASRKR